jgi:hypothetical protein
MSIGSKRHATSVVVDDGRIVFVGSDAEAMKLKAEDDLHAAFQLTLATREHAGRLVSRAVALGLVANPAAAAGTVRGRASLRS